MKKDNGFKEELGAVKTVPENFEGLSGVIWARNHKKMGQVRVISSNPGIESTEAETIEQQVERLVNNNEPVEGQAPLIFTERKEGVRAEMNIRTDRFEIAIDAMDKVAKSYQARREERQAMFEKKKEEELAAKAAAAAVAGNKGEGKP